MKRVYIAHPLGHGPDREKNLRNAARWVAWAGEMGMSPIAPWIILASIWDGIASGKRSTHRSRPSAHL